MKTFFKTFFAVLMANVLLAALLFIFLAGIGASMKAGKKPDIKEHSYLVIDIYGGVLAYDPPESFPENVIGGKPETLHRILSNLEKAAADDRIAGVLFKLSANNDLGFAMVEEIRSAIKKVQQADKPVYAYSDNLDRKTLFLAAACDSIFMPPSGNFYYVGYASTVSYVKGTLEKLGITAHLHKIKDYKSAAEMVTRKDMSPEAREMRNWLMDDLWEMEMAAVTQERGLTEEKLVEHMEYALFTAQEAEDAGLVDELLYWDQLKDRLKSLDEDTGDDDPLKAVSQGDYAKVSRESVGLKGKNRIAVVHAHGMIGGRESKVDPMLGMMMGHETVSANLMKAAKDDKVAAIIFRVDSGGGEGLASDLIGHTVDRIAKEKPVIVSMIDVAASGGYMISFKATKMIADEMTITGSIGSISGKFNTNGMYDKLGISFDHVSKGPNGLMMSGHTGFTQAQRRRFEENHWDGFNHWLEEVAERRGITFEEAENLAHGRVFTGRQAMENGLIDDVGGLDRAIEIAKEEAGIDADENVTLVHYPAKKGLIGSVLGSSNPLDAAVRWALYKFIHQDLAESYRLMTTAAPNSWSADEIDTSR
jgi:protease-4